MVNRGPAARGEKAAQNQSKQKGSDRFHNCGLSIHAMRGLPPYQNQLPWQLNIFIYYFIFSVRAIYFASPFDNPIQNLPPRLSTSSGHWQMDFRPSIRAVLRFGSKMAAISPLVIT